MSALDTLQCVLKYEEAVTRASERLEWQKCKVYRTSAPPMNAIKVSSSHENSREDALIAYLDAQERLKELSKEYASAVRDAMAIIDTMKKQREAQVLTYRYMDGMKWKDIADKMGYSLRGVYTMHKRIIDRLEVEAAA